MWPLEGRRRPSHTKNSKNFPHSGTFNNNHVELSENPTKKGQSCQGEKRWKLLRGSQTLARPLSAKEFWGEATRLGARDQFGEWVKLAELAGDGNGARVS